MFSNIFNVRTINGKGMKIVFKESKWNTYYKDVYFKSILSLEDIYFSKDDVYAFVPE